MKKHIVAISITILFWICFQSTWAQQIQNLDIGSSITNRFEYDSNAGIQTSIMFKATSAMDITLSVTNLQLNMGVLEPKIYLLLRNESTQKYVNCFTITRNQLPISSSIPSGTYSLQISPHAVITEREGAISSYNNIPELPTEGCYASLTATIKAPSSGGGEDPQIEIPVLNVGDEVSQPLDFNGYVQIPSSYSFAVETDVVIVPVISDPYVNMGTNNCIYLNLYDQNTGICIAGTRVCESGNTIELSQIALTPGTYIYRLEPFASVSRASSIPLDDIEDLPIIEINYANLTLEITVYPSGSDDPISPFVKYTYDSSGNCIGRNIIVLQRLAKAKQEEPEELKLFEDKQLNIKIYPNPTRGLLKIEIPEFKEKENITFSLYNLLGKLYKNEKTRESFIELDLSSYPKGTYILRMNRNGQYSSWRIIKID